MQIRLQQVFNQLCRSDVLQVTKNDAVVFGIRDNDDWLDRIRLPLQHHALGEIDFHVSDFQGRPKVGFLFLTWLRRLFAFLLCRLQRQH